MNLKFWRHKTKNEVIKPTCYDKLPYHLRQNYYPSHEEPTHHVEEDNSGNFLTNMLLAEAVMDSSSDSSNSDSGFSGYDGGSGGGGGADSGWSSSSDSGSSSSDSGSSYDSGSSSDSSSSSSDY